MIGYEKIICRISQWINAGYLWICNEYPFISKKDIHSYPKWYPSISFQDILEISDRVDNTGYLRISQDVSGYLRICFGANSQIAARGGGRSPGQGATAPPAEPAASGAGRGGGAARRRRAAAAGRGGRLRGAALGGGAARHLVPARPLPAPARFAAPDAGLAHAAHSILSGIQECK